MSEHQIPTWQDQPAGGAASGSTTDRVKEKAGQAVDTARQKAGQAARQAEAKADEGIDKAAGGLDRTADMLRERGGQQGGVSGAATMVADRMDQAAQYLREKDTNQLMTDLEELVRRRPLESFAAAVGVGFLLSKALR